MLSLSGNLQASDVTRIELDGISLVSLSAADIFSAIAVLLASQWNWLRMPKESCAKAKPLKAYSALSVQREAGQNINSNYIYYYDGIFFRRFQFVSGGTSVKPVVVQCFLDPFFSCQPV